VSHLFSSCTTSLGPHDVPPFLLHYVLLSETIRNWVGGKKKEVSTASGLVRENILLGQLANALLVNEDIAASQISMENAFSMAHFKSQGHVQTALKKSFLIDRRACGLDKLGKRAAGA
jgi:hypothetical protein